MVSCFLENQERSLVDVPISAAAIELADLSQVRVFRERRHIDLLIVVPDPYRWVFIVENKVHSGESRGQLKRYAKAVEEEYADWHRVGIYLTLDGQEASAEGQELGYIPFSHERVAGLLTELLALQNELSPSVRMLLEHYLHTLRRLTMSDPEIVELCQTIYQRHRKALDLIMEYGASSRFSGAAVDVFDHVWVQKNLPAVQINAKTNSVWFVPAEWEAPLQAIGGPGWPSLPLGVACFFYQKSNGDRTLLAVEVGPIDDHPKRVQVLEGLKARGFRVPAKAFDVGSKYTRVYSDYRNRKDGDDDETVMLEMLKKAAPRFREIGEVLLRV